MLDKQIKHEVNEFIASEVEFRDQLITRMEQGIVDPAIWSDLLTPNLYVTGTTMAGIGASVFLALIAPTMGAAAAGIAVAALPPVAWAAYRKAQASSVVSLSDDRYTGPKFPILLAPGVDRVTLNAIRNQIEDLKKGSSEVLADHSGRL